MDVSALDIPVLTTERLRLEPLSIAHSAGMFDMWRHAEVQRFSGRAEDEDGVEIDMPARTSKDSDRLIRFWLQAARAGWGFRWAIVLRVEQVFIGHIGFNSLAACSEIAYHLNPKHWGGGLMTEAAKAAIAWRGANGGEEIEAFIEPANLSSIALALRLGMRATSSMSDGAQRYEIKISN